MRLIYALLLTTFLLLGLGLAEAAPSARGLPPPGGLGTGPTDALAPAFSPSAWERATVDAMNERRTGAGLGTLHQTYPLDLLSRFHSVEMAQVMTHTHASLGREWGERAKAINYPGVIVGEVVGYAEGGPLPVVTLWWDAKEHPEHYAIVTSPDITELGCGAAQAANGWVYVTCVVGQIR